MKKRKEGVIEARVMGLLASLVFAVPAAALVWFGLNKQLALYAPGEAFLSSSVLVYAVTGFALVALVAPGLFPSLLGWLWRGILGVQKWWGW